MRARAFSERQQGWGAQKDVGIHFFVHQPKRESFVSDQSLVVRFAVTELPMSAVARIKESKCRHARDCGLQMSTVGQSVNEFTHVPIVICACLEIPAAASIRIQHAMAKCDWRINGRGGCSPTVLFLWLRGGGDLIKRSGICTRLSTQ